ncbi:hypothetical protein, partial [uncultured Rikenella sp.]|uniref:hypothetical protein n=1 Tax=uncultured Rikenella sp. TaxID=368003 RepID=UPI00272A2367
AASTPILCPRAGGNLIQTQIMRLNDFLFQQSRAGRALTRLELFSLASPSSSPLGNLQTAFALHSLAASVVNKENQKNFRRMLTHPQAVLAQITAPVSVVLPGSLSAGARD